MGKEYNEAKAAYMDRYDKENTTRICLKLNNKTDADIIQRLNEVSSKQGYIKNLIRRDMKGE